MESKNVHNIKEEAREMVSKLVTEKPSILPSNIPRLVARRNASDLIHKIAYEKAQIINGNTSK